MLLGRFGVHILSPQPAGEIDAGEAEALHGIRTRHDRYSSGEVRFRLLGEDGNGYILTRAQADGWQQSHVHYRTRETYIVEAGWMVLAIQEVDDILATRFGPGEIVTTPIGQVHNVYLPKGAVIHTVKHGARGGDLDRTPAPEFDEALDRRGAALLSSLVG